MSIRPVSRCQPKSQALWDDSNLPMCVVLTPCHEEEDEQVKDDDQGASSVAASYRRLFAKPMSAFPKCLHCGAPHPTLTTHFRPQYSSKLLCFLCGRSSSTLLADQQDARKDEYLDPDTFDKISIHDLKCPVTKVDGNHSLVDTLDFRVPLEVTAEQNTFEPPRLALTWQLPAMACPPVWWIVVDGTIQSSTHGAQASRNYWNTVGNTLDRVLDDIPAHVHIGLLTATSTRLSCWNFTTTSGAAAASVTPQVQQVPYTVFGSDGESDGVYDLCLVPANEFYKNSIEAAVRAMVHEGASGLLFLDNQLDRKIDKVLTTDKNEKAVIGFPLGMTLEIILQFMEQARQPGQDGLDRSHDSGQLKYAGGKILCLVGNPPMEIVPSSETSISNVSQPPFAQGGVAGACFKVEKINATKKQPRSLKQKKEPETFDPTDVTAANLKELVLPLDPEDLFSEIGKRCGRAALGVDVVVLVPEQDYPAKPSLLASTPIRWYGLPLLRILSDASGSPGPLMFGTTPAALGSLVDNIRSRSPWHAGMTFGCKLRLRLSPGLELEDTPVEKEREKPLQLAPFLSSGGLMGPAHAVLSTDVDSGLWMMGSCDPHTSFTVDMQAAKRVKDRYHVDGFGEVAFPPVIQTCLKYTCIETSGGDDTAKYYTVCKLRVSSLRLPLVDSVESIFDELDPEALASVLFHKVALDAYIAGLTSAQVTAESWLRSLMLCVYESAQAEQSKLEEKARTIQQVHRASSTTGYFFESERLLNQDGDLEVHEVLLGYGHPKIAPVPLIVFALMQCDALRPSDENYQPSMDARLCAITQMASMPPWVLAKAIAPSLVLWSLKDDESITDSLPLSKNGIRIATDGVEDGVLLMDSPKHVLLCPVGSKSITTELGENLESMVLSCLKGYRTLPGNWKELEAILEGQNIRSVPKNSLDLFLLEDKPTASGFPNFSEWKMEMAFLVQEELEKNGSIVHG